MKQWPCLNAIVMLLIALSLTSCSGSKEVAKAKEFLDAGMFDQAAILLKQEIQTNPKNAEAHMLLGVTYLGLGQSSAADQEFNTAFVLDEGLKPAASKRCYDIAKYLMKTKQVDAYAALMKAKTFNPSFDNDGEFFFAAYVQAEYGLSNKVDGAKRYLTLYPSGPHAAEASYTMADATYELRQKQQARDYFRQTAAQFPGTEWGNKANERLANWTHEVQIRVTDADDVARCFLNGTMITETKWGDPNNGSHQGVGQWIDVSNQILKGKENLFQFTLWNASIPGGWSGTFQVMEDGKLIYSKHVGQTQFDSEGMKFDEIFRYTPN